MSYYDRSSISTGVIMNNKTNSDTSAKQPFSDDQVTADIEQAFGINQDISPEAVNRRNLLMQFGVHGLIFVTALSLWAAIDAWRLVSGLAFASGFSVFASIVFGIAMAHILHEWSHFLGAYFSGSDYTVKEKPAPLFFDFDYKNNSQRQFLSMSVGGTVGNILFLIAIYFALPLDSFGRMMLLAVAIGMTFYVSVIEFPVIKLACSGKSAMESLIEHLGQGQAILNMALLSGLVTAIISFLLILL